MPSEKPERITVDEKTCPRCKQTKPWHGFAMNSSNKNGLSTYCRTCASEDAMLRYRRERAAQGLPVSPMPEKILGEKRIVTKPKQPPAPVGATPEVLAQFFGLLQQEDQPVSELELRYRLAEHVFNQQAELLRQLIR